MKRGFLKSETFPATRGCHPCIFAFFFFATLASFSPISSAQYGSILTSRHNLSASGPGPIRSINEQEVCIFCHTPHNASPIQPLWNRHVPVAAYTPYTSNSLQALPGQPTGSSKLCLSCHDGTIALGSVLSRNQPIPMAGGMTVLPPGHPSNLGTDLSDDHPVSFRYDSDLISKDAKLKNPALLPPAVRLDGNRELQCTTCHDAHSDANTKFLVMDNSASQLCKSCHNQGSTDIASHDSCDSCHKPHTAPSGPYLLTRVNTTETCNACHSAAPGATQGANIAAELNKLSRHDTNSPVNQKDRIPNNTACNDCHESHTILAQGAGGAPMISPRLGQISGVNSVGAPVARAQFEYEVCLKCHADVPASRPRMISRQIVQTNKRLQLDASAVSFHPVETAGRNTDVPSLRPGLTTASVIYCTDCHASDMSKAAGGSGPNGPHGSNEGSLLIAGYSTADATAETANAYALCYRCHDRANILSNASFSAHSKHIVDQRTPCSVCHDSHGIAAAQGNAMNNSKLINFDISVVQPDPVTNRLEYRTLGPRTGECFLSCHGVAHSPQSYPVAAAPAAAPAPVPAAVPPRTRSPLPSSLLPSSRTRPKVPR